MLTEMELALDVKKQVESMLCPKCKYAGLTFKSVEFYAGFVFREGERVVVGAHFETCKCDPAMILEVTEDGYFD